MRNASVDLLKPGPTLIEQAYDAILAAICDGNKVKFRLGKRPT